MRNRLVAGLKQLADRFRGRDVVAIVCGANISRDVDVPVGFFFDEMSDDVAAYSPGQSKGTAREAVGGGPDPMAKRETLDLVPAYYNIHDASVRKRLLELIQAMAKDYETEN